MFIKMHDILLYSSLYPTCSNPFHGIFVKELTRHLIPRVGSVRVVAPIDGRKDVAGFVKGKYFHHRLDDGLDIDHPVFWTFPRWFKQLDGQLVYYWTRKIMESHRHKVSVIHVHYAYPEAFAAGIFAEKWNIPFVITVHGSDMNVIARDSSRRPLIAHTLRKADAVVAVSEKLKKKVVSLTGRQDGVYHIPNGMDPTRFYPGSQSLARKKLGLSQWKQIIVFVGRLEPVKGLDRLIQAISTLEDSVGFIIVGQGSLKKILIRQVQELGMEGRVQFYGAVEHHRLVDYFQAADLLALASYSEGWPTIILEAMACGIPVVSPAVGGVPEIIINNMLGVLTSNNQPKSLSCALKKALETHWDRNWIYGYAQKYTWDTLAHAYLSVYDHVSRKKSG